MSGNFGEAMDRLYTDPGVSRDELPALAEGIMSLADGPVYLDSLAGPAFPPVRARNYSVPPEGSGKG